MIDFSEYTREYIQEQMLDQVDEDIDTREGSMVQTAVGPGAWFLEGLYMTLSQMQDNSYSQTAVGEYLDMITEGRGIVRKAAVAAVRQGTFDAQIPEGSIFQTLNGDNSVNFVSGELISQSGGTYIYELTCQDPGIIGNSYTGPILPVTAINNLTQASIGTIITVGTDEETDDALRARYDASFDVPAFGGNISSYRNTILSLSGVGAVQIYPAYQGGGTALCSIIGEDFKPASSALVDYVQNYICPPEDGGVSPSPNGYGFAPIGAAVDVVTATELDIDVEFDITMETGISFGPTYQTAIEAAIGAYILSAAHTWGAALVTNTVSYSVIIYVSQIIAAILSVEGVANVTNLTVNSGTTDIVLTETSSTQQIPVLGTVIVHE
jgi:uncharacterized phage protein gp47/JayE